MAPAAEILAQLDRRVAALKKARPDLAVAIDLQEQLIRTALNSARPPRVAPFAVPRELAAARIRQGIPLLHDQPASVDVHFAADLFSRLVNVLQQRENEDTAPQLQALVSAATGGALDPERLFVEAFVQHRDHLFEMATQSFVDADLLVTL